jgi:HEPN domain-containing protein
MVKTTKNWIDSAEYDLATAKSLLKAKRKVYVIFMCHLAVEKMLKGLFSAKFNKLAPYTHNLIYLLNLLELKPPVNIAKFIELINDKSVPTRYPENISEMERTFSLQATRKYLDMTEETITWLRQNIPSRK